MIREYQNSQADGSTKLVQGKIGKQQFVVSWLHILFYGLIKEFKRLTNLQPIFQEQEATIIKRKDECKERIIAINSHLV